MNENIKNSKDELYNEQGIMINEREIMISEEYNKNEDHPLFNIGRNIIYKNKYIFGIPDHLYEMISLLLIFFLTYIVFIIFIFPYFYYKQKIIISSLIFLATTSTFILGKYNQLLCFFTEPGIIPRKFPKYISNNLSNKYILSKITKQPIIMIQRYCKICSIKRPKKCLHCYFCDNCVEEFENHCQYISNCVGKRNRKYFFFFLFYDLFFLIQIFIFSFIQFCFSFLENPYDIKRVYIYISMPIVFIGIILILILFNLYYNFINKNFLNYALICSNFFFIISFYYSRNKINTSLKFYVSPFNIVLINVTFKWAYYFFIQFIHQINMIAFNMTSFEYTNLINYMKIINKDNSYSKLPDSNDDDAKNNIDNNRFDNDSIHCTVIKDIPSKKEMPKFYFNDLIKNLKNMIKRKNNTSLLYQEINNY